MAATLLEVREGIYRATPPGGRGRKRRRGEFVAVSEPASLSDTQDCRTTARSAETPSSSAELRVSEELNSEGQIALRLRGTLELATVLPFREAVFAALGRRPSALVLDLDGVDEVDSTGVSTLVTVNRVANLLRVPCHIRASNAFRGWMETTGVFGVLAVGVGGSVQ